MRINDNRYGFLGNIGLLHEPKTAFFSSQKYNDSTKAVVSQWTKQQAELGTCIISGFNSELEMQVLGELLACDNSKIIMVLAKNIPSESPKKYARLINEGRMLIISPLKNTSSFMTKESAHKRNEYILENCDQIVVGDLTINGMLDGLLKDKNPKILGERK